LKEQKTVHCIDQPYTGMGNTPEEAKKDMMDAMKFHKETCIKEGIYYPGFLDEPFEVTFDTIPWF